MHQTFQQKLANWLICGTLVFSGAACQPLQAKETSVHIKPDPRELIVLAAINANDPYYQPIAAKVFDFHLAYARKIAQYDRVLVLTDDISYMKYMKELGADKVAITPQLDIWARDFSLSNANNPMMFRYTSAGQGGGRTGQDDADAVQKTFAEMLETADLSFAESDLLNDGGNFVDDYAGNVVISRKFLRDNHLSEGTARQAILSLGGVTNVAFIEADEQGGLEHADGVVAFIGPNSLVVNSYPTDPAYAAQLHADLRAGLPGVVITELVTPYDGSQIYDQRFGSACGLYTNMLVTPERIYFPQFGIAEDQIALEQLRAVTSKTIVLVLSEPVCQMGGGVRCMSWQLRGENAESILRHFGKGG
ncbi:MAG: peptide ABC transporter permease [Robiginitomaculum sp.]|nr:MAG: peptide ABC transporter permease [Robiginitomaculum sp.]